MKRSVALAVLCLTLLGLFIWLRDDPNAPKFRLPLRLKQKRLVLPARDEPLRKLDRSLCPTRNNNERIVWNPSVSHEKALRKLLPRLTARRAERAAAASCIQCHVGVVGQ